MPRLCIMSWNLRTFATQVPSQAFLRVVPVIILKSHADVVCIQELQTGKGVTGVVGAQISASSANAVKTLTDALAQTDSLAGWRYDFSGTDSGRKPGSTPKMRDAYAFLWKQSPSKSDFAHDDPLDEINAMAEPVILGQQGADNFPGRRPGMLTVNVRAGKVTVPVNLISYHAQTPANQFSKKKGAGCGIDSLATLPEIGGGQWKSNGNQKSYTASVTPLPQVDTVVLGDFNFTMGKEQKFDPYKNLLTNYEACISTYQDPVKTTYSMKPTEALRLVSAYDNIFVLRKHNSFTPALKFSTPGWFDFIRDEAKKLGDAIGCRFGTESAWYVIHLDNFKKQHAQDGISDHIPVWAECTISGQDATAQHIKPTSSARNNSLIHAILGTWDAQTGRYLDVAADTNRQDMVKALRAFLDGGEIPDEVRAPILKSMSIDYSKNPIVMTMLSGLLTQPKTSPFSKKDFEKNFEKNFAGYIDRICTGRLLYVHEAELLAVLEEKALTLHSVEGGKYVETPLNPKGKSAVHIYYQTRHFFRWDQQP